MAGKIHKANWMHKPWKLLTLWPDWRTLRFWHNRTRRDNRDDTLLLAVVDEFARDVDLDSVESAAFHARRTPEAVGG